MKLSVVIPCYNEEQNVPRFAEELWPILKGLGYDFEIIIVDDGSRDETVREIKKINKPEICLVRHDTNRGLGVAIRTGINASSGELLVVLDADLTFHPNLISRLLEERNVHPEADFIIGSPNLGGYGKDIPVWRLIISKVANGVYRVLLGREITSINQIFRLYKTEQLKGLKLEAVGFDINAEILFKLVFKGKNFIEVPAKLTNRLHGKSKLNYAREIRRHLILIFKIIKWKFFGF